MINLSTIRNRMKNFIKLQEEVNLLVKENTGSVYDPDDLIMSIKRNRNFYSMQKDTEVKFLMSLVHGHKAKVICEIGSSDGGTLFLLSRAAQPDCRLISIDISYYLSRMFSHRKFAQSKQKIICIKGDSKSHETIRKVQSALHGHQIDVLFIDGDHSLEGVMNDFVRYSPLVKKGGMIFFHDIQPDFSMKYGKKTKNYSGGVPIFWSFLKQAGFQTDESIEDPDQDGFGMGVLYKA